MIDEDKIRPPRAPRRYQLEVDAARAEKNRWKARALAAENELQALRSAATSHGGSSHENGEPMIVVDDVTSVLLADGWHPVIEENFMLEPWSDDEPGFAFETNGGVWMHGPLTSVLAVQTEP